MNSVDESWSLIQPVTEGNTLLGFIAIHRGNNAHPAFGATRIEDYPDSQAALTDALNLSSLMSHKAALAGIPYGGGKGVLFNGPHMLDAGERARTGPLRCLLQQPLPFRSCGAFRRLKVPVGWGW